MSDMLFEVPETKSHRMLWIERHGVALRKTDRAVGDGEEDQDGNTVWQWYASKPNSRRAPCGGATEDDALVEFAKANGLLTWQEESLAKRSQ